ncbi:Hypothetical protein, putative [Bodo saltans]|uniref:Uncharacterized protein n=1 Tax=Bodo saltans TaxID=75058 RepID=A0A0S4J2X5_BODSA|nr:Hypothetical protein, putative [Bodo saltans]|eukprot:CUG65631.1 Hypothetical protein, putative [Bodo saltans]
MGLRGAGHVQQAANDLDLVGTSSDAEYFRVRLQYVQERWYDGYIRCIDAEKQQIRSLLDEYADNMQEFRRDQRNAYRQMMKDFEHLCERDKVDSGLAVEEEQHRMALYEKWLADYQQLLPNENRLRDANIADQRKTLQDQVAATRRARQSYEEALTTMDDIDTCRREQNRARQTIVQQWHDVVVIGCYHKWHLGKVARNDLNDLELWIRCNLILYEEEFREATLQYTHQFVTALMAEEEFERTRLNALQFHSFMEDCVRGAFSTMQYELWWMAAKDVPRRWDGETITY